MRRFLQLLAGLAVVFSAPDVLAQSSAAVQEGVDASFGPWDVNGTEWTHQTEFSLDGADVARKIGGSRDGDSPRATVVGPVELHFSYRSGIGDFLSPAEAFTRIDSGPLLRLTTSPFWQEGSIQVGEGTHLVSWLFSALPGSADPQVRPDLAVYLDQVWAGDDPRPRVTSASLVEAAMGSETSYQITVNKPPDSLGASGLPPGLTLNTTTGMISGTPTSLGSFPARVRATNAAGSHTRPVIFRVLQPSVVAAVSLDLALEGAGVQWDQKPAMDADPWSGFQTDLARDGVDAATVPLRVAPRATKASNWLGAEVQGPGTFLVWHRIVRFPNEVGLVSSGRAFYSVRFDGRSNSRLGTGIREVGSEWGQSSIAIPPGRHLLEFSVAYGMTIDLLDRPNGDALALFDQASFIAQPQSFTFLEWMQTTTNYLYSNIQQEVLAEDLETDGLGLLVEYALGGSPAYDDAALLPEVAIIDGHLTMTVHKSPGTTGVEYTVQANKSLAGNGWTTFGTELMDEDENVLVVRCTKTVVEEPRYLLRLRVRLDDSVGP